MFLQDLDEEKWGVIKNAVKLDVDSINSVDERRRAWTVLQLEKCSRSMLTSWKRAVFSPYKPQCLGLSQSYALALSHFFFIFASKSGENMQKHGKRRF